jgi:hypothetical protein
MKLANAMELAGQNLLHCLSPRRNYLPFWSLEVDPDLEAEYNFWWPAHNIGRWWDATLRLEASIGFSVPAHIEAAMLQNLQRFFDNPDHVPFAPFSLPEVMPFYELHSLREGLLALTALVRYRSSRWAAAEGNKMVESVLGRLNRDNTWNTQKFHYYQTNAEKSDWEKKFAHDLTITHGRLLEAVVWFYEATCDPAALELADRLARHHLQHSVNADGSIPQDARLTHTHSWFGTLRGLLLYGEITLQREYIDVVEATYRRSVRTSVKESGFIGHDFGADTGGETTSPGDAAQIALWLGLRHGYTEYLDDAERIIRARMLPSQFSEPPAIRPKEDNGRDEFLNLAERSVGAFGGVTLEPHAGKRVVTDVTAAGLHTCCDIYDHIVTSRPQGTQINFHFDYADDEIVLKSERSEKATLTINKRMSGDLFIRIPGWVPGESVAVAVDGAEQELLMIGAYAYVPARAGAARVVLTYDLPEHTSVEPTDGVDYHISWRGDDVSGIWPNSTASPFYPDAPEPVMESAKR